MNCPICQDRPAAAYRPFCSRRCADLDLGKWLGGFYAIPATEAEEIEITEKDAEKAGRKPH